MTSSSTPTWDELCEHLRPYVTERRLSGWTNFGWVVTVAEQPRRALEAQPPVRGVLSDVKTSGWNCGLECTEHDQVVAWGYGPPSEVPREFKDFVRGRPSGPAPPSFLLWLLERFR